MLLKQSKSENVSKFHSHLKLMPEIKPQPLGAWGDPGIQTRNKERRDKIET